MIGFSQNGAFEKTKQFLKTAENVNNIRRRARIEATAAAGVAALEQATPKKSGTTAAAWGYDIEETDGKFVVSWTNDNIINGVNIAIIIQYGHATKNGGRVVGIDYINPALRSIFNKMSDDMWKAVVSL